MKKITILILLVATKIVAQTPLFIPDTLLGPSYNLTMHVDSVQFFPGQISHTYAFNNNKYLGPTLILNKGENININVTNLLPDTTTVHWHGLHVPAMWDGGPFTTIMSGQSWHPQFKVMDNAATYWYHPHLHKKTALQAIRGAAGLIIVRDSIEAQLNLPRKYGIDDFPIIVQCQQYDSLNQAMPLGMQDSTLLVNGTQNPYLDAPAQMVRMRLLNASGERAFNFGFSNNIPFKQIASDGGLLNSPFDTNRVRLGPGERAEIVINLQGINTPFIYLMSYASEMPMGMQGGPTMPMPVGSPPMDSPLNGINFNILKINIVAPTQNPVTTIPATLTQNIIYTEQQANMTRTIRFTADSLMVMDGPFYFNDSTFDMMRVDYKIPLGSVEIWKLVNMTMVAHPFHIHDVQFYLLDRNESVPSKAEQGRKDVVLVPAFDSVRFITKFTDFVDTIIPYMYHCHILMHEDAGMMGQFMVVPNTTNIKKLDEGNHFNVYPNPTKDTWTIKGNASSSNVSIQLINAIGSILLEDNIKLATHLFQYTIPSQNYPAGIYHLTIRSSNQSQTIKIIKTE